MSRAEEAALGANCPKCCDNKRHCGLKKCPSMCVKCGSFIQGYQKAEKDLALTWEDMKLVIAAEGSIYDEHHGNSDEVFEAYPTEEEFYREVLRRFQELKAEKENERPSKFNII